MPQYTGQSKDRQAARGARAAGRTISPAVGRPMQIIVNLCIRRYYLINEHQTSVPPPERLFTSSEAPIIAARSCMPAKP